MKRGRQAKTERCVCEVSKEKGKGEERATGENRERETGKYM